MGMLLSVINLNKHLPIFDASENYQLGFQDPASSTMEGIINFHNYIMVFIMGVLVFVFYLLAVCLKDYVGSEESNGSSALPNSSDLVFTHSTELKVIGHQWFWSYEYPEMATSVESVESATGSEVEKVLGGSAPIKLGFDKSEILAYDSYMLSENDLSNGLLRLLEVDKRVVLPVKTHIRVLVTAADVLHSWAVPSFGVKVDACPGRLNQASLYVKRTGIYFGQCSEICGVNHGFMPIAIKVISKKDFLLEMELSAWGSEEE